MITTKLIGTLRGRIWMPPALCISPINVNLTGLRARYAGGALGSFRHAMCSIVADGNFQSASLTRDSEIVVTSQRWVGRSLVSRSKVYSVTEFPSIRDLLVGYRSPSSRKRGATK